MDIQISKSNIFTLAGFCWWQQHFQSLISLKTFVNSKWSNTLFWSLILSSSQKTKFCIGRSLLASSKITDDDRFFIVLLPRWFFHGLTTTCFKEQRKLFVFWKCLQMFLQGNAGYHNNNNNNTEFSMEFLLKNKQNVRHKLATMLRASFVYKKKS